MLGDPGPRSRSEGLLDTLPAWREDFCCFSSATSTPQPFPSAETKILNPSAKNQGTRPKGHPSSASCVAEALLLGGKSIFSPTGARGRGPEVSGRTSADLGLATVPEMKRN